MRTKYNKRRVKTLIMIIVLLLCMSIGYSYLLTTLNIEGTSNIKANTWDVHWENVSVKSGSVTGDQVPIAAHVMSDTTQVEYSVILKNPGDYYEFTVDAKNAGTLDAMVSVTDTKFYEANGVTQINLPDYLEYSFTYAHGVEIEQNHLLESNSSEKYEVRLKFKDNLDESELPSTDKTIVIRQSVTYVQADENATPPRIILYSFTRGTLSLSVPEEYLLFLYPTPEEVISDTGYPFFLKHEIRNGIAYTSEVGFKYNGNIYYLKGGVNESNLTQAPIFSENKSLLINALGSTNCDSDENEIICEVVDFTAYAKKTGIIGISAKDMGMTSCLIKKESNNYYMYCGDIAA